MASARKLTEEAACLLLQEAIDALVAPVPDDSVAAVKADSKRTSAKETLKWLVPVYAKLEQTEQPSPTAHLSDEDQAELALLGLGTTAAGRAALAKRDAAVLSSQQATKEEQK